MLPNFLIGLREGLEAALVVSILVAFLVRTDRRHLLRQVAVGVGVAVALSVAFGAVLQYTSTSLLRTFESREVFGGVASIVAVGFVTWMIFWMRRTARHLKADLTGRLEAAVGVGAGAVVAMAFIAVFREGLETALFFWASAQAAGETLTPLTGFLLGIAAAVTLGWLLYRSAVRLNLATFFTWTGAALIFVAAGVLAYGVHDLQEGGVLTGLNTLAFDVSSAVPPSSWYGTLLKGVLNFSPQTTVSQAIAWTAYVLPVLAAFLWPSRPAPTRPAQDPARRPVSA
ncbi:MAG TPA: iron uptake transporter permease EfeU [Mycobacteriales bacterium]|nr:iron uptake transporter permease EfeU [Mycobacteriales bacterium]